MRQGQVQYCNSNNKNTITEPMKSRPSRLADQPTMPLTLDTWNVFNLRIVLYVLNVCTLVIVSSIGTSNNTYSVQVTKLNRCTKAKKRARRTLITGDPHGAQFVSKEREREREREREKGKVFMCAMMTTATATATTTPTPTKTTSQSRVSVIMILCVLSLLVLTLYYVTGTFDITITTSITPTTNGKKITTTTSTTNTTSSTSKSTTSSSADPNDDPTTNNDGKDDGHDESSDAVPFVTENGRDGRTTWKLRPPSYKFYQDLLTGRNVAVVRMVCPRWFEKSSDPAKHAEICMIYDPIIDHAKNLSNP